MEYRIVAHKVEGSGERHFCRVAIWFDAERPGRADAYHEFLVHAGSGDPVVTYVVDRLGQRRTRSGRWLPLVHEVDGEWVPYPPDGPDGDPWETTITLTDPFDDVARVIEQTIPNVTPGEDVPFTDDERRSMRLRNPVSVQERAVANHVGVTRRVVR